MMTTCAFRASPAAVAEARAFANEQMRGTSAEAADVVELLVSELASNAVTHARTPFTVTVHRADEQTRVEVTDRGDGEPRVRAPEPLASSGRGLQLLTALADSWGVQPAEGGKTVWLLVGNAERSDRGSTSRLRAEPRV
jgi:anti-sigma regulatory factor (Ser/Thr protein kinase)